MIEKYLSRGMGVKLYKGQKGKIAKEPRKHFCVTSSMQLFLLTGKSEWSALFVNGMYELWTITCIMFVVVKKT